MRRTESAVQQKTGGQLYWLLPESRLVSSASSPTSTPKLTPDFFVFEERYRPPVSTRLAASLSVGVAAAYGFWIEYCAHWNNDRFPYPFLTMMEVENRIYIYLGAALFAFLTFQTLNALHK